MSFLKSFPPPEPAEGLRQQQPDTEAVLNGKGLGTGTLYIAESRLSWLDGSGLGFSLEYPTISLHAVSRDLNAYPQEHLYVMVNAKFEEESRESLSDEEEDSDDDVEPITEFRFVPSDKSACECSVLLIFFHLHIGSLCLSVSLFHTHTHTHTHTHLLYLLCNTGWPEIPNPSASASSAECSSTPGCLFFFHHFSTCNLIEDQVHISIKGGECCESIVTGYITSLLPGMFCKWRTLVPFIE
ncbi:methylosome subunit pICln isoform X1 [Perognathus longimembris pacificus]|uniref:methylosome subunit pICln isoform X1 n=1 Tax=Perognathus longimembris pacificus TaxID=214514 RepID=UPI002019EDB5|nr:methylosome subunit pICln isoform X1 [Perognathus longimembris pacificus]